MKDDLYEKENEILILKQEINIDKSKGTVVNDIDDNFEPNNKPFLI